MHIFRRKIMTCRKKTKLILVILLVIICGFLLMLIAKYKFQLIEKKSIQEHLKQNYITDEKINTIFYTTHPRGLFFGITMLPDDYIFNEYIKKERLSFENSVIQKNKQTTVNFYDANMNEINIINEKILASSGPAMCVIKNPFILPQNSQHHDELYFQISRNGENLEINGSGINIRITTDNFDFHWCRYCSFKIVKGATNDPRYILFAIFCKNVKKLLTN